MIKRGRILRDANNGPGLLTIEGNQYSFTLEGMWLSEVPPKPGMIVEADLGAQDVLQSVKAVPESQIAKEQADVALSEVRRQGGAVAANLKAKFGVPTIIAFCALFAGWFLLDSVSVGDPANQVGLTFWQTLGLIGNADLIPTLQFGRDGLRGGGIWDLLCVAALAGPLLSHFRRERLAALGGLLPLAIMLIAAASIYGGVHEMIAQNAGHGPLASKFIEEGMTRFMSDVHLAIGAWASLIASALFAYWAVKRFLIAGA